MPNGYFLEGFVRFVDPADDGDVVSMPFMGFVVNFKIYQQLKTNL